MFTLIVIILLCDKPEMVVIGDDERLSFIPTTMTKGEAETLRPLTNQFRFISIGGQCA